MKTILPTLEQLQEIDLSSLATVLASAPTNPNAEFKDITRKLVVGSFQDGPGVEAYALYAYLSTLFDDGTILDIGTLFGSSALALSYNPNNKVITYDVNVHNDHEYLLQRPNISYKHIDFMTDDSIVWEDVKMILIDTDHNGAQETEFVKFLIEKDWSGLLLLDDIHINPQMEEFWSCFEDGIKVDVTHLAHSLPCGSGFVEFDLK